MNDTINNEVTNASTTHVLLAGRYRGVRQLGQGGMGAVWLAEDEKLDGHQVAIKMLPSILVNNKRAYAQVKKEALVSLQLAHPNIATVRAFEEDSGNPFLVMDFIDGQTLDDYLAEKGTLSEEETINLLSPIAAALDYAHAQGVVHRDVKPANVLIRKDGTPFILDFGIAREMQETMTRMTGKTSSGTLMYMSPEQLNGEAPKPAQDVYSFAAMAYECLKGEPPFCRGAIEDQIKNKIPEPLPGGSAFAKAILCGLAKSPEARPRNCQSVVMPIVQAKPPASPPYTRGPKPGQSHTIVTRAEHHQPEAQVPLQPKRNVIRDLIAHGLQKIGEKDYRFAKTPVTQELWKSVMDGENPSKFIGDKRPVERVSWTDCQTFIERLNSLDEVQKSRFRFRLPTRIEWHSAVGRMPVAIKSSCHGRINPKTLYGKNENWVSMGQMLCEIDGCFQSQDLFSEYDGDCVYNNYHLQDGVWRVSPGDLLCTIWVDEDKALKKILSNFQLDGYYVDDYPNKVDDGPAWKWESLFKEPDVYVISESQAWTWENSNRQTHTVATKQRGKNGLFDMFGNVCEWCSDGKDDMIYCLGGSFISGRSDCTKDDLYPIDTKAAYIGLRLVAFKV